MINRVLKSAQEKIGDLSCVFGQAGYPEFLSSSEAGTGPRAGRISDRHVDSRARGARFVDDYNGGRLHVAIGNLAPVDLYRGRQREVLSHRKTVKRLTLEGRRKKSLPNAA